MPPAVKMPVLSTELSGKSLQVKFYVKLGGVCCLDELGTVRTESKLAGHHPPLRSAGPLLLLQVSQEVHSSEVRDSWLCTLSLISRYCRSHRRYWATAQRLGTHDLTNCCCSVTKSCPTLCNPMNCSTPGSSILYYLPEFAQIHVHWISDAV